MRRRKQSQPKPSSKRSAGRSAASGSDSATEYAEQVVAGRIPAGRLVRSACRRHLDDLRTAKKRGYRWNPEEAERVISVFAMLRQSKGRWADQPLVLQPWQCFIVGSIFGWQHAASGLRRFRTGYVEIARKNGKSTLAAGVGLVLTDFDGESGAEVYAAATKRDQAKIVWTEGENMVKRSPEIRARMKVVPSTATMYCEETASKFQALGADANSLDGLNTHGAILDELHAHRTREVVDVLETSKGARLQPLFFYITTAGVMGDHTIYAEQHGYARRVVEAVLADDEWFVFIATLDDQDEWTDPSVYAKANPSLGVTVELEDLVAERDRAKESPGRQNAFRRLRLNQRTEQVDRWIDMAAWDDCPSSFDPADLGGRRCFGGLDLASTTDLAAAALVFPPEDDDGWRVLMRFWVPEENARQRSKRDRVPYDKWIADELIHATEGNVIDYDFIRSDLQELADRFEVVEWGFDPWNAQQLVTQLQADGMTMVPVRQGVISLSAPTKDLEKLVLGRQLNHGGNPVLRWMMSNVSVRQDAAGNIKPDKARSTERIDGVLALVVALSRANVAVDDGGSVYDQRGFVAV